MKKILLSVRDFAVPSPLRGSIEAMSGLGRASQKGLELHQIVQHQREKETSTYKAETFISHEFELGEYLLEVSGRMDGFFDDPIPRIEEIKSSFNAYELFRRLKSDPEHPYCLQVKTYGYFHFLKTQKLPELSLHLISSRNGDSFDYTVKMDLEEYKNWLDRRLAEIAGEAERAEERALRRRKSSKDLEFPFPVPRDGQMELIQTIEKGMEENHPMLLQAPTGLGKTVGVLYPTFKEALARGQRAIYITPKNSQHQVAEEAADRLAESGAKIKSMTLTAKSKMCFKNEPICNPDYCEYAKDHYTKMAQNKVLEKLSKKKKLTSRVFKKIASEAEVCPFEIQLDAADDADLVICDYNYVFAPRSAFGRIAGCTLDQVGKPNLIIDEAHNLPSRAMDYYSPSLSVGVLEKMREDIPNIPKRFQPNIEKLLKSSIEVVKSCGPENCTKPCDIDPPVLRFVEQDEKLRAFLTDYLKSDVEIEPRDVVLRLSYYWTEFTNALEYITINRREFFTTFNPHPATVRIVCCDASEMLKANYEDYDQVVAFSATLKPFEYYRQLMGLDSAKLKTAEFASPFPKSKRKLLVIPQISSKYSERERNYPRISEVIHKVTSLKKGNYLAFFPSFDFLERVLRLFTPPPGFSVIKQERGMKQDHIQNVLETLKNEHESTIVFAVQGGVFSEGVDYPGKMVIGAFVVGTALPVFDLEHEKMREYYEETYASGFDYTYTFPAMAKAVQAAGRVIRSETDHGVIILMDGRFVEESYSKSMPADWFDLDVREMISRQILEDVREFWSKNDDSVSLPMEDHEGSI
ncbi:MAG: ATP-dependent DNA helicase [Bdellovibrionales bacterium]